MPENAKPKYPLTCNVRLRIGMDEISIKMITGEYKVYTGIDSTGATYCFRKEQVVRKVKDEPQET